MQEIWSSPDQFFFFKNTAIALFGGQHCLFIEKEPLPDDSRGLQLAKTYYGSCINEFTVDSLGLKPIKAKLTELFGGWRLLPKGTDGARTDGGQGDSFAVDNFNLTELIETALSYGHGVDIFQLLIEKDPRNSSRYAITVSRMRVQFIKTCVCILALGHSM